jgi:3-hydroxyisobutyrate dehydrogenase-like beta-hydroxyacid dehydrogenase
MTNTTTGQTVSVIGLGVMGTALAKAFLANHHRVTVWNRTASKCEPLAHAGAHVAESVATAAEASQVLVVCVLDYPASTALLHTPEVTAKLKDKTVVQFTTVTPRDAREEAAWAQQQGIAYLNGVIMSYPKGIGTPACTILYAGPKGVFEAHQPLLHNLGGNGLFVGENIAHATVLGASGGLSYFAGTVLAFLHGAALCEAERVPLDTYLSVVLRFMPEIADTMQTSVEMITKGSYPGSQATVDTWAAAVRDLSEFSRTSGVDSTYLEGILGYLQRAIAQGHGQDDVAAVFECFRTKAGRAKAE